MVCKIYSLVERIELVIYIKGKKLGGFGVHSVVSLG